MTIRHLRQRELAARWNISHRTLERWRWTGEGPHFVKLGGRVVYRLDDIEAFERAQVRDRNSLPRPRRSRPMIRAVPVPQRNTTHVSVRTRPRLSEIEFCAWVAQAGPGDRLEYHRGFLALRHGRRRSAGLADC